MGAVRESSTGVRVADGGEMAPRRSPESQAIAQLLEPQQRLPEQRDPDQDSHLVHMLASALLGLEHQQQPLQQPRRPAPSSAEKRAVQVPVALISTSPPTAPLNLSPTPAPSLIKTITSSSAPTVVRTASANLLPTSALVVVRCPPKQNATAPECCGRGHFLWKPDKSWLSASAATAHVSALCMGCPPGKYEPLAGTQAKCRTCSRGKYSTSVASASCALCSALGDPNNTQHTRQAAAAPLVALQCKR